uniref:Protein phosphatase n=1 Tax=Leersia perrieri TaxID=77586 RepID=A0A0D9VIN3_9ORYZ
MEALVQIQQTLSEIDRRIPDALRIAMGVQLHATEPAHYRDEVTRFAAFLFLLPPGEDGAGDDPMECDGGGGDTAESSSSTTTTSMEIECEYFRRPRRPLRMVAASCYLPDHDEDMHFLLPEAGVVGVADGVGGCSARGVDAAAFSRALMSNALKAVADFATATGGMGVVCSCPYTLLELAYSQAVAANTQGASTAVLLSLDGATLRYAYVGDSAFAVVRDGVIVHRSETQNYFFNCPFQLCVTDGTSVTDAARGCVEVEEGDVVVVGTDGLFDNVFDRELRQIVSMGRMMGLSPKQMADVIAGYAFEASTMKNRDTPFSAGSRAQKGTSFQQGKRDDITVVVAYINDRAIPDVIRAAVGLEHHYRTVSVNSDGVIKSFTNSLLCPPEPEQKHDDGDGEAAGSKAISSPRKRKQDSDDEAELVPSPKRRKREAHDGAEEGDHGEVIKKASLRMDWKSCYVPHHNEGAHFGYDDASVVAVADGVGGSRKDGVDASAFARGLMTRAHELLVTATDPTAPVCPYTLLAHAYDDTAESGASTAVILALDGDVLKWTYVGDSGFAVLRDGKIVHRSKPQTRYFNAPCYLSRGGGVGITEAKVGETTGRRRRGGRDGRLFDNVSDADLEKVVQIVTALGFSIRHMVDFIAGAAYEMSRCPEKDSPFVVASRKQRYRAHHHQGGKIDDITVVVARVVSSES